MAQSHKHEDVGMDTPVYDDGLVLTGRINGWHGYVSPTGDANLDARVAAQALRTFQSKVNGETTFASLNADIEKWRAVYTPSRPRSIGDLRREIAEKMLRDFLVSSGKAKESETDKLDAMVRGSLATYVALPKPAAAIAAALHAELSSYVAPTKRAARSSGGEAQPETIAVDFGDLA